jgi:hypothetical protein
MARPPSSGGASEASKYPPTEFSLKYAKVRVKTKRRSVQFPKEAKMAVSQK